MRRPSKEEPAMPEVQMQVKTTGENYRIEVKPWRAFITPASKRLEWSCTHNGAPVGMKIVLFTATHFQGGQPKPGKHPKTGPIRSHVKSKKPYRYRIRVRVRPAKGRSRTIVIDPEYERHP
jgi:hypothetical protein